MARQSVLSRKKRGPPATGKGTLIGVRLQPDPLSRLDKWSKSQDDKPSRPEAIRRLVELGLATSPLAKRRSQKSRAKASEMAGQQIDKIGNASATEEQRQQRKRRLIKGPSEFRDMRGDQPKPKG
jgi:hypothetical protein